MNRGFRGQAIYVVQSPPILGDLGGEDLSHEESRDLMTRLTGYLIHDPKGTESLTGSEAYGAALQVYNYAKARD